MENQLLSFDINNENTNIIKVVGVGGGGNNAVNHMYRQGVKGVDFIVCNTDSQALENSPVPTKIQMGSTLTQGRGAGSIPEVGRNAAIENIIEMKEIFSQNTKMAFITAGMGGGTGTGGAPVIAAAAKELGILTVGIVTLPFNFEGKKRKLQADYGIEELKKNVDTLIIICNDKLREIYGNLKLTAAFGHADDVVTTAAKGISDIITTTLHINTDFADIETVLRESGVAIMGSGSAKGENRAQNAIESALNSPLLNDNDITGARYVLLNVTCGDPEITMDELSEITDYVQAAAGQSADIIHGYGIDPTLGDEVKVTLIATGFQNKQNFGMGSESNAKQNRNVVPLMDEKPAQEIIQTFIPQLEVKEEPAKIVRTLDEVVKEEISETSFESKLENSEESFIQNNQEQENQLKVEFEINLLSAYSESLEPVLKSEIVSSTNIHSESATDSNDSDKIANERVNKLRQFNYRQKLQQGQISELESVPAYVRKNLNLDEVAHSSETNISKFTLGEGEDGKGELRQNNSFLHDNVD
jgi:cell division protein FtsZ